MVLQQIKLCFDFWVLMELNDVKTYFSNPFDENLRVFVFCDAPHTLKNIRNRLVQQNRLKVIIWINLFEI